MDELVRFPDYGIMLPPRYYGEVGYYVLAAAFGSATVDYDILFDKRRKEAHRSTIADKDGTTTLTASIAKPHGIRNATWRDVGLSPHGRWWHVHRVTLESAYGRTPFFEFYIDRFLPFLSDGVTDRYPTLASLNSAIDNEIRRCLGIREVPLVLPVIQVTPVLPALPPYWQIRANRLGFLPNLSVLDLIFNLGPEAPLYLRTCISQLPENILTPK